MAADSDGRTVLGDSNGDEVIFRPQRPGDSVSCQQPAGCSYRDRPRDCRGSWRSPPLREPWK